MFRLSRRRTRCLAPLAEMLPSPYRYASPLPVIFAGARAVTSVSPMTQAITDFANTFGGQLIRPTDFAYEETRKVHNGLVNKRPALIARCQGVSGIVDAVNLARKLNLEVA